MKKLLLLLLALAIPVLLFAAEPMREWKTKSGKSIQAAFDVANDSDPQTVYLLKDGKRFKIPFEKLSQTDQNYVTGVREKARSLEDDEFEEVADVDARGIEVVPAGNRYALLIGVNEYNKPIKPLRYCVNDMKLLAESFEKIGVPKENIFLVTDDSPAERRPTLVNIRQQIEIVTQLMGPNDQLTIAFSGHGAMVDGKSYLCPSDTNLDDKNSVISRDWAFEQLEKCKAKQKIFIIDACRDEVSFGDQRDLSGARTLEDPIGADTHGFILIASCDKKQKSWEHSNLKHGVFTYFLAEGLAGAAKDEDGYVSIMNIFQYASAKTKKYVYREFNKAQVPTFRQGDEMTDFCLAKVERVQPTPIIPTPAPVVEQPPAVVPAPVQTPSLDKPGTIAGERKTVSVNGVEFAFRYCPPGTFTMGSPETEEGRWDSETQHQVTLTKGFWMMETEVTQKQWKAVMGTNPSNFNGDDLPVENVSWNDCQEFCQKCTQHGLPVQLPTEAQWEYACRAGTTTALPNGNIRILGKYNAPALDPIAWYGGNSSQGFVGQSDYNSSNFSETQYPGGPCGTHPVGKKNPNAWGLYDMIGNILEWCQDWKADYPSGSVTDPAGPSSGSDRVGRGSSWINNASSCRSACRGCGDPDYRRPFLGFRCVRSITSPEN